MSKYCPNCKVTKEETDFQKHKNRGDGLQSWCKVCFSKRETTYRERRGELRKKPERREYQNKYNKLHGKEMGEKWRTSDLGRETIRKYRKSLGYKKSRTKWRLSEKGRHSVQIRHERRRANLNNAENTLTLGEWRETLESYNGFCVYCNKKSDKLQQDHIVPLSKGGGHTKENVVPACPSCNSSKGNRPLLIWMLQKEQRRQHESYIIL
jgi:5-methylcytosine-specific restriction endonuclease McrA